ncbi:MAG: hypothetical protein JSS45_12640 [Proteobacteria bacterium]|nr:hypothetical protein [Pseudomonadota bacterium]
MTPSNDSDAALSIPEVLRRLRLRLLDLSAGNRLLNFKITARSRQQRLRVAGKALSLVPGRLDAERRQSEYPIETAIDSAPFIGPPLPGKTPPA